MIGIYDIQTIALVFLGVLALVSLVYHLSRRAGPVKAGREKNRMYIGGEDEEPEDVNVTGGVFRTFGKILGIYKLREAHSGDLSRYLTWILIGMLLIILIMVMMW